ncbi:unnamed protein product [Prunus armeniaca]
MATGGERSSRRKFCQNPAFSSSSPAARAVAGGRNWLRRDDGVGSVLLVPVLHAAVAGWPEFEERGRGERVCRTEEREWF